MNRVDFGKKTKFEQKNEIFALKSKGQKVTLRLLDSPYYDAKHFIQEESGWSVFSCPRIMTEGFCQECDDFFKAAKELKKLTIEKKLDDAKKKELEAIKKKYNAALSFYYPAIDRDTELFMIFKTTLGVRLQIDTEFNNGIHVLEYSYVIERTEKPGSYYSITRLPEVKKFTDKEEDELKRFSEMTEQDIETMIGGTKKKSPEDFADVDEESHIA